MARTKQTARRSTGGKAPRKQLATKSRRQFVQFSTQRQAAGFAAAPGKGPRGKGKGKGKAPAAAAGAERVSYINCDNTFSSFAFALPATDQVFAPQWSVASHKHPVTGEVVPYLGLSLLSKYDGDGIRVHGRPCVDMVVVVDISGSMQCPVSLECQTSKLEAAKACLVALLGQLKATDRVGVVLFNHDVKTLVPVQAMTKDAIAAAQALVQQVRPCGSTDLSRAAEAAMTVLDGLPELAARGPRVTSRLLFMTDLNSTTGTAGDEKRLLDILAAGAKGNRYTTVVGLGMDLNKEMVQRISAMEGGRYCSADNDAELTKIVARDFDYDVTVTARDIHIRLDSDQYELHKGFGSPDIEGLKPGTELVIKSEFPNGAGEELAPAAKAAAKGMDRAYHGGVLLFQLKAKAKAQQKAASVKKEGKKKEAELPLPESPAADDDGHVRKRPRTRSSAAHETAAAAAAAAAVVPGPAVLQAVVTHRDEAGMAHENSQTLGLDVAEPFAENVGLRKAIALKLYCDVQNEYVTADTASAARLQRLLLFQAWFADELASCGDETLASTNQAFAQMLAKMIELEEAELQSPPAAPVAPTPSAKASAGKKRQKGSTRGRKPAQLKARKRLKMGA